MSNFDFSAYNYNNNNVVIAVHDGVFHADDVLCVALLGPTAIIRSRVPAELNAADVIADVSGGAFDHHMKPTPVWDAYDVPHCAASLVWERIRSRMPFHSERALEWFERTILVPICRQDNGVGLEPHPFSWVSLFNPVWDEESQYWDDTRPQDAAFNKAAETAVIILNSLVDQACAIDRAQAVFNQLPDTELVEIPGGLPDWGVLLSPKRARLVLYQALSKDWNLQVVPADPADRFSRKVSFPEEWAGKKGAELAECSGFKSAVFCHVGRFLAVFHNKEDAVAAARRLLQ